MNQIYGHQWASQQSDEPNDTWIKGLADVTPIQFGTGLRALLERTDSWPPNLVEFRQLCLETDPNRWERQAHKIYQPERGLVDLTSKEQRASEGLANIKKLREEVGL